MAKNRRQYAVKVAAPVVEEFLRLVEELRSVSGQKIEQSSVCGGAILFFLEQDRATQLKYAAMAKSYDLHRASQVLEAQQAAAEEAEAAAAKAAADRARKVTPAQERSKRHRKRKAEE